MSILIIHAIDDAQLVINHVRKLMSSSFSSKIGLNKWFDDIENVLNHVLKAIQLQGCNRRPWNGDDNEELDNLEDVLNNAWSQSWASSQILNKLEGDAGDLLFSLIEYWVDEIKTRGYVVHGLLDGSEDLHVVKTAFNCIPIINYPPKYGSET